jgi:hypothetical protein
LKKSLNVPTDPDPCSKLPRFVMFPFMLNVALELDELPVLLGRNLPPL